MSKKTKVEIKERTDYDLVLITLPNGSELRLRTSPNLNEVEVTHSHLHDKTMYIKPLMGNSFLITSITDQ